MVPKWPELLQYGKKNTYSKLLIDPRICFFRIVVEKKLDFVALLGAKTPLKPALSVGLSLSSNKFDKVTSLGPLPLFKIIHLLLN